MLFIGVDGGMTGAIAFYSPDDNGLRVYSIPGDTRKVRGHERTIVDPDALNASLAVELGLTPSEEIEAWCEAGVGDRRQSSSSAYNYGFTNGGIWMALATRLGKKRVHIVYPTVWKRHFGLINRDKEASRYRALKLFPEHQRAFQKKGDHNRAEAALIARYGYETNV